MQGLWAVNQVSGKSGKMSAIERHKAAATLDGATQWTCTPGAALIIPEEDELYNRKADPFQLKNIIKEQPKVAEELLRTLKAFAAEMKVS